MQKRLHNKPGLIQRRRKLRRNLTPAEAFLWTALKDSSLAGRKFRRQHSVGPYILDFFCVEELLAVELDGEVHRTDAAAEYDYKRKVFLNGLGIKVIRFENFLVFQDILHVLGRIESFFGWSKKEDAKNSPSGQKGTPKS